MKKTLAESRRDDLIQSIMLHQEDWADSVGVNTIGYTTAELNDLSDAELESIANDYDKNPPGSWEDDNDDLEVPSDDVESYPAEEGEEFSKFSGMGRRMESVAVPISMLKTIIKEGLLLAEAGVLEEYQLNETFIKKLLEAEYKGREVSLNKPMKGDVKKFKVYVKDKKTGNVKKVNFGDPNAEIKRDDPERRKNFRARHGCGTARASDKTKPAWWSCKMWGKKPVSDILKGE